MRRQRGFTLIELLIVIAIIGLLAGIVIANMRSVRGSAQIARTQSDIRAIVLAISLLENDTTEWPGHAVPWTVGSGVSGNEVWDLNAPDAGVAQSDGTYQNWKGDYMNVVPMDPWGNNYFFDPDYDVDLEAGETWAAVVGSFGPNGDGQNVYDADNIFLEMARE